MAICLPSIHFCNFCPYSISIGIIYSYESSTKEKVYFGKTISMFAGFIQLQAPQRMGNIRPLMILYPNLRVKKSGMGGWGFPGHYSKYAPI